MSGLYRLLNHEFGKWLWVVALLCAADIVLPLLLLHSSVNDYQALANHARYEDLYASTGAPLLFFVLLMLLCAYFLYMIYADYWGSKSIYTYLTMPVRRESLYLSRLLAFFTCLLLLVGAQLFVIQLGYVLFVHQAEARYGGQFDMNNGLFLAFARSDYFRLLLPMNFSRILSTVSMLLVVPAGFYYGVICERSRHLAGFVPIAAAVYLLYRALMYRLDEASHYSAPRSLYPTSILLLLLCGWFVWDSLRLIRRGAIA